ncbi:OprD family outer membrane porin [Shewanella sp. A14]
MKKTYLAAIILSVLSVPAIADTTVDNMFSEGSMKVQLRLFDFSKDYEGATQDKHDTSIGGLFYYKTAEVNGISFGTTFASSNKLWADDTKAVYSLLGTDANGDHQNVNRMQEYYVQGEWWNTTFRLGAQEIRSPYMNPHDIRAIPRSYRGFSVTNKTIENLSLSAFYITDSIGWNENNFIKVNEAIKADLVRDHRISPETEVADNPVYVLGANYKLASDDIKANASLWTYNMADVFNLTHAKVNLSTDIGDTNVYLAPSYLIEKSIGDETGGAFDTYQYGVDLGVKFAGADLMLKYGETGDDALLAPWGDDKVVIMQSTQAGNRANETAKAIKLSYDFGAIGIKGLKAFVYRGQFDVSDISDSKVDETDLSLGYSLDKWMKGLSVRARHAIVEKESGDDFTDTRFYIKYNFNI